MINPIAASWDEADIQYIIKHNQYVVPYVFTKANEKVPYFWQYALPGSLNRFVNNTLKTDFSSANYEVFLYGSTGFDDPRDYEAVELGYDYYDRLYAH